MAAIVPFPSSRRVAMVQRLARQMLSYKQASADKLLASRLKKMAETLSAHGVPDELASADVDAFHAAVQAELWRQTFTPERPHGGAA
ncbi:DUF6074 family protein [Methylocella sp. CPCC 101449]|uniref:DUF6074 family protein n=1 Tax=Methylocella sp. CPCC 101449 TaxID=2987531 RepID=UPI00288C7BC0|nr:DUF6074 family protein [Methylocella sp. CPCC 101449]MDT2022810.1 DUF6074 family protein [Methylocella sp. CPCC 101449]